MDLLVGLGSALVEMSVPNFCDLSNYFRVICCSQEAPTSPAETWPGGGELGAHGALGGGGQTGPRAVGDVSGPVQATWADICQKSKVI